MTRDAENTVKKESKYIGDNGKRDTTNGNS